MELGLLTINTEDHTKRWWIAFTVRDARQELHISEQATANLVAHRAEPSPIDATLEQMNQLAKAAIDSGLWVCWCDS